MVHTSKKKKEPSAAMGDSDEEDIRDDADADADADNGTASSTCPKKHGLEASYPHVMTSLPFKRVPRIMI